VAFKPAGCCQNQRRIANQRFDLVRPETEGAGDSIGEHGTRAIADVLR
jgi:hypothetical protein